MWCTSKKRTTSVQHIQCTWVWETYGKYYFIQLFYGTVGRSRGRRLCTWVYELILVCTVYKVYESKRNVWKSTLAWLRLKWRSIFPRTCLYSVCERGRQPKITISVGASYKKVVGSQVKAKMAIKFFPYMPIQSMWAWETAKNHHFCTDFL